MLISERLDSKRLTMRRLVQLLAKLNRLCDLVMKGRSRTRRKPRLHGKLLKRQAGMQKGVHMIHRPCEARLLSTWIGSML